MTSIESPEDLKPSSLKLAYLTSRPCNPACVVLYMLRDPHEFQITGCKNINVCQLTRHLSASYVTGSENSHALPHVLSNQTSVLLIMLRDAHYFQANIVCRLTRHLSSSYVTGSENSHALPNALTDLTSVVLLVSVFGQCTRVPS